MEAVFDRPVSFKKTNLDHCLTVQVAIRVFDLTDVIGSLTVKK